MNIENYKIGIIGAVRSGLAVANLIKEKGGIPFVSDIRTLDLMHAEAETLFKNKIAYEFGIHSESLFASDLIVTSPGVPTNSFAISEAVKRGIKVVSELEFASQFCKAKIIAITGTNGKTTTTSLVSHLLNVAGIKNIAAGNIGLPFSKAVQEVGEDGIIVLEVSSFQLDFIEKFRPNIAVILNITPDHLDRYENNFQLYINSKMKIVQNQTDEDVFIFNAEDETILKNLPATNSKNYGFALNEKLVNGCYLENKKFILSENGKKEIVAGINNLKLQGEHNYMNAMATILIAKSLGISYEKIKEGLETFDNVEHRLELVLEKNGIKFINDSKATNPFSTYYALRSFERNIRLILGGKDKGNDYSLIENEVVKRVTKIYAVGSSAQKVFNYFNKKVDVELIEDFNEAIHKSMDECANGDILLLSPACASFDQFKNYEERGKQFKKLVKEYE